MKEVAVSDRHFELPAHPNLEYYRKQAKHLQHTYETGEAVARARVADVLGDRAAERFLLGDAQFVLAREHGFRTWAEFRAHVQSQSTTGHRPVSGRTLILPRKTSTGPSQTRQRVTSSAAGAGCLRVPEATPWSEMLPASGEQR
jgi:hypothetical protein